MLSKVPGVRLFSIQKNAGLDQLDALAGKFPVTDLGRRLDETTGPFMDTAAVLKNLDLFITSDTAVAHLAGALGVPVWMALSTTHDWRWMTHREDNPWYPTMRVFRQDTHMVWGPVFERMAAELRVMVPARTRTPSVMVGIAPGELIDKITILEIKAERLTDPEKVRNVRTELAAMSEARDGSICDREGLVGLTSELKAINEALWEIEDDIRACESAGDFGPRFIDLARAVYQNNDRRAAVIRRINERLGSGIIEEKSYKGTASEPPAGCNDYACVTRNLNRRKGISPRDRLWIDDDDYACATRKPNHDQEMRFFATFWLDMRHT